MSEIYPFLPAAVEVFRVGSKTDMILRKDIKKQEQTDDEGKKYTVYACDERQQRVDGVLTAEEVGLCAAYTRPGAGKKEAGRPGEGAGKPERHHGGPAH